MSPGHIAGLMYCILSLRLLLILFIQPVVLSRMEAGTKTEKK